MHNRMRRLTLPASLLLALATSLPLHAESQPTPFAAGKAASGKRMIDKDCVACHARMFNGDGDKIYLREERKVRSPAQLMAQVQVCNTELRTSYFPEEEEHVAAYLNLQYYKFRP